MKMPRLSVDEEFRLAQAAHGGDCAARQELIRRSLPLVALRVTALRVMPHDVDDAFQDGVVGLIQAIDRFDPTRGARLSTWSWDWITSRIRRARRSQTEVPTPTEELDTGQVDSGVDERLQALDLERALSSLDAADRDVLIIRHGLQGHPALSAQDAASALGIGLTTLRRHEGRAIAHLGRVLDRVSDRAPH